MGVNLDAWTFRIVLLQFRCIVLCMTSIFYLFCLLWFQLTSGYYANDLEMYLSRNRTKALLRNRTIGDFENPYCDICCLDISGARYRKICQKHTMCRYKFNKPGPNCKGFLGVNFTDDEKDVIVDFHNTIRNLVALGKEQKGNPGPQPEASNMRVMGWDPELAYLAERWAAQCVFGHDLCRDVRRYPVGQNIAKGNYAVNDDLTFLVSWYDNVELVNDEVIRNYQLERNDILSQYTQLLWAETYQVGCARVAFQKAKGSNVTYREHFVCNYGPSGNIPGQSVYKISEPCSQCPEGTGCLVEYPGLCGSETVFEIKFKKNVTKVETKKTNGVSIPFPCALCVIIIAFKIQFYIY